MALDDSDMISISPAFLLPDRERGSHEPSRLDRGRGRLRRILDERRARHGSSSSRNMSDCYGQGRAGRKATKLSFTDRPSNSDAWYQRGLLYLVQWGQRLSRLQLL